MHTPKICLIHVGKTGGTYIKDIIRHATGTKVAREQQLINSNLVLLNHKTLTETANMYGEDHRFAFIFREPTERFISGFHSRLRMGVPERKVIWSPKEAAAFAVFKTPNELAEALYSDDTYTLSAAHYSMNAIRHLHRGYEYHFGKQSHFIIHKQDKIVTCIDLKNLDMNIHQFLNQIGIEQVNIDIDQYSEMRTITDHSKYLSELARLSLKEFWKNEYNFYELFQKLEKRFFTV